MDSSFWIQAFGYLASAIVVASFAVSSLKKLRIINGIGAILSVIFALLTASYPFVLMNTVIAILDIYQLIKLKRVHSSFELVPADVGSGYFQWFTKKHEADIRELDPEGKYRSAEKLFYYVCDNEVAGLLAYDSQSESSADIVLDYVTEKFRDLRIGRYFFGAQNPFFREVGISEFTAHTTCARHAGYLRKLHFVPRDHGVWAKSF